MSVDSSSFVDLRSDTVTKPTAGMREAMAMADVGDDVFGEDPTVNALEEKFAGMMGKEAAIYTPSGTMANLIAILAQTRPGDTVILTPDAHPYKYEAANIAVVGGLLTRTVGSEQGILTADAIRPWITRTEDPHRSETTLIAVENTTNMGGGAIYPLDTLREIGELARGKGLRFHCDGARLFNAVAATDIPAAEYVGECDTVSVCFSKGLGAPVGSATAGSREVIARARKLRKMLGGGMRQAGVIAAAASYALDHHVDRLKEDHRRAAAFRREVEGVPGIEFPMPTPTNLVFFDVANAMEFVPQVGMRGVLMLPVSATRIRAVFHLDVDDAGVDRAIEAVKGAAETLAA